MIELGKKLCEMNYDGLVSGTVPAVQTGSGTIKGGASETVYKRGTLLSKSSDGFLAPADGTGEPYGILCDDLTVAAEDAAVVIYTAGCFDPGKIAAAEGYELTEADFDALRKYNIVFKAAQA